MFNFGLYFTIGYVIFLKRKNKSRLLMVMVLCTVLFEGQGDIDQVYNYLMSISITGHGGLVFTYFAYHC